MWWTRSSPSIPPLNASGLSDPSRIIDRRTIPPGVVPKHVQQWVVIGIAVVMVAIMSLSSQTPAPRRTPNQTATIPPVVDANQQRIEEYERRVQEQAQRLATEQAQLQVARETVGAPKTTGTTPLPVIETEPRITPTPIAAPVSPPDAATPHVADNVAYSRPNNAARPVSSE